MSRSPSTGSRRSTVRSARRSVHPGSRILAAAVPRLASEMHRIGRPAVIVLDDVHRLLDRTCLDALASLLDHLPPGIQVALAARTMPDLPVREMARREEPVGDRSGRSRVRRRRGTGADVRCRRAAGHPGEPRPWSPGPRDGPPVSTCRPLPASAREVRRRRCRRDRPVEVHRRLPPVRAAGGSPHGRRHLPHQELDPRRPRATGRGGRRRPARCRLATRPARCLEPADQRSRRRGVPLSQPPPRVPPGGARPTGARARAHPAPGGGVVVRGRRPDRARDRARVPVRRSGHRRRAGHRGPASADVHGSRRQAGPVAGDVRRSCVPTAASAGGRGRVDPPAQWPARGGRAPRRHRRALDVHRRSGRRVRIVRVGTIAAASGDGRHGPEDMLAERDRTRCPRSGRTARGAPTRS